MIPSPSRDDRTLALLALPERGDGPFPVYGDRAMRPGNVGKYFLLFPAEPHAPV